MKKSYYLFLLLLIFITSCEGLSDKESQKKQTVCIYEGVPVRELPSKDGKWVSKLNLGETLYFLGEEAVDSTDKNKEYLKVELSDGTVAWAMSYGLIVDAKVAAVKENVSVYERPELVTLTKDNFNIMDILAIEETKDNWIKVAGKNKRIKGWIKKDVVTENEQDVAVAILASKQGLNKSKDLNIEKIQEFIDNIPYKNSFFLNYLKQQIKETQIEVEEEVVVETDTVAQEEVIDEEEVIEEPVEEVEGQKIEEEIETEGVTEE
jgi:hypothetical protein